MSENLEQIPKISELETVLELRKIAKILEEIRDTAKTENYNRREDRKRSTFTYISMNDWRRKYLWSCFFPTYISTNVI
jgi:hypothetical protein